MRASCAQDRRYAALTKLYVRASRAVISLRRGPQVSTLTSNSPFLLPLHDPFSSNPSTMLEASVLICFILCATTSVAAMVRLPHSLSMYIRLTAYHLQQIIGDGVVNEQWQPRRMQPRANPDPPAVSLICIDHEATSEFSHTTSQPSAPCPPSPSRSRSGPYYLRLLVPVTDLRRSRTAIMLRRSAG